MIIQRNHLLTSTILVGVMAFTAPAFAQSAPQTAPGATAEVDEIVVTGSRIRRDPTNAPTPLIQVTREELLTTGQSTVIDYLATIPALANSQVPSDVTGVLGAGGLSLPNLRSLGSGRTLTLIDGRRQVGSSGGSLAVDIDTIPRLLIQNVEIVTGGASSVYGADAVSGVLNFVLRKDFEGLEIDANYGQINSNGEATRRISALIGKNFFDDRLNVYAFGEYEKLDEVQSMDIHWLKNPSGLIGIDADPTNARYDGKLDQALFRDYVTLQRPRWGQTTLANNQQASPLNNPNVPFQNCGSYTSANCYSVDPTKTWVFEAGNARLANFGQRIGNTGANRPNNIGGDGDSPASFSVITRVPESKSSRFQVGSTFKLTENIRLYGEAKYVDEDTHFSSQPDFYDFYIRDFRDTSSVTPSLNSFNAIGLQLTDNAYLPSALRTAITNNTMVTYAPPADGAPSVVTGTVAAPYARHTLFGEDRDQVNNRQLQRYVVGLSGDYDQVGFIKNLSWDASYNYGQVKVVEKETGTDVLRVTLASDAVFDQAGVLGTPGAIVCRSKLIAARGGVVDDYFFDNADLRDSKIGADAVAQCTPLNVFGQGNQSQAARDYINASVTVHEKNVQEQGIATVSGQLWDFWGAGSVGVALGYEHRREYTEAIGRDATAAGRVLFLNGSPDMPGVEYKSDEVFAEVSLPLFRDSFLGEYAELSGSYRYADYTTVGKVDVYGVNLVYRPIRDIAFKTSYNTSVRVPDLSENFSPNSETFANGFIDPCATLNINAAGNAQYRDNRIKNCTALAAQQGLTFDFAGATATNVDDYNPNYSGGGISGVQGGNPNLTPEESKSFTFSTVIKPRFIPNFSLVLDYYEIEITNAIETVSAQAMADNCVNSTELNASTCSRIFRNNPDIPFGLGAPSSSLVGGFIEGSLNYAARKTRGLDFTATYGFDIGEMTGHNWGRLDYKVGGTWLIDQNNFLDSNNPSFFTSNAGNLFYPRVRLTSSLTYTPNDTWSVNWTADWQTANKIIAMRDFVLNADSREVQYIDTGDFTRNDFTVRWNVRDNVTLRAGVVNAFNAEQAPQLGQALYSNFDPYGRRFFIGLNYKAF